MNNMKFRMKNGKLMAETFTTLADAGTFRFAAFLKTGRQINIEEIVNEENETVYKVSEAE